jgi:hypothetical protein
VSRTRRPTRAHRIAPTRGALDPRNAWARAVSNLQREGPTGPGVVRRIDPTTGQVIELLDPRAPRRDPFARPKRGRPGR